ncbi:ArnT family glycosyltransferase [Haloarchaeobius salinus]|uniref:ArnT family glycosyltransferase n=1 Tax=Haloarchaeobius salinus TaxID=1198298 RepID=UPI00210C2EA2|nr:glycosyltransferase family 39 protein [Haloarchaeobius salinus]
MTGLDTPADGDEEEPAATEPGGRVPLDTAQSWLVAAVVAATVAYLAYVLTHPYPAYGAGLYMQIADEITGAGFALPETIPQYTEDGVPFAYPPLLFYALAGLRSAGANAIVVSRFAPGLFVILAVVPYYFIARELLDSRRVAGFATFLFACAPAVLQWHLSAGGLVRAPSFLFAICGVYTGIRTYRDDRRWAVPSAVLFGLTVLSHPVYTVFFGLSHVLLFLAFDRTPRGLVVGALVATAGALIAAPWWVMVVSRYGPDVFLAASGTHSGLGGGLERVLFGVLFTASLDMTLYHFLLMFAAGWYFVWNRRFFLPAWFVTTGYLIGKRRFLLVAGSMMAAVFVYGWVVPRVVAAVAARRGEWGHSRLWGADLALDVDSLGRVVPVATVAVVATLALTSGVVYAMGLTDPVATDRPPQPAFMDEQDQEAMDWIDVHTGADEEFVVLGDSAEWFPLFSNRTLLVGPWGVEWKSSEEYGEQMERYRAVSECATATCLTRTLERTNVTADYVYVPNESYTVRGEQVRPSEGLHQSLVESPRYQLSFENDGVLVFHVVDACNDGRELTGQDRLTCLHAALDGAPVGALTS